MATSAWGVVGAAAHLPPSVTIVGAAVTGVVSTMQAVHAKWDNRRRKDKGDDE